VREVVVPLVTVAGLKAAVTPAGSPDAENATGDAKPPLGVSVTTELAVHPAPPVSDAGEAANPKFWMPSVTGAV